MSNPLFPEPRLFPAVTVAARSMTARAMQSFMLPVGLLPSSLTRTRAWSRGTTLRSSTKGVFPMASSTFGAESRPVRLPQMWAGREGAGVARDGMFLMSDALARRVTPANPGGERAAVRALGIRDRANLGNPRTPIPAPVSPGNCNQFVTKL